MFPTALVLSVAGLLGVVAALPDKKPVRAVLYALVLALAVVGVMGSTWPWPWGAVVFVGLALLPTSRTARVRLAAPAAAVLLIASLVVNRKVHETYACLDASLPPAVAPAHAPPLFGKPGGLVRLLDQTHTTSGEVAASSGVRLTDLTDVAGALQMAVDQPEARVVRLVLDPGSATGLVLTPSPTGTFTESDRKLRAVQLPLESTEGTTVVEVDLSETLEGGWDQADALRGLEVAWTGGAGTLHEVVLEGADAVYRSEAVGEHRVELDGVIHPSWTLLDGATVELTIQADEGDVLTWFDGGLGVVERVASVDGEEVHRTDEAAWSTVRIPLSEGRHALSFAATGTGVGLIGEPIVASPAERAPNVLVILVDTLRADHVDDTTPNWLALQDEGVRFALTNSASSWTKPSIPTVMSGVWPTTHGVGAQTVSDRLPESVPLMQERFRDAGWATASFSASPLGSTLSGLDRGFATALPPRAWGHMERSQGETPLDADVFGSLLDWWDDQDRPVFAYVQLLDLHQYYLLEGHADRRWSAYRHAAVTADADFGQLMEDLEERGLLEDTLIVLTSDHGESFWDHGVPSHGTGLWQSQVQVPLVFWHPELAPGVITEPTALADLAPTLIDLFGLPSLPDADGISLVPALGSESLPARSIPSALIRYTWNPDGPQWFALTRTDGPKVVQVGDDKHGVDLAADLCESISTRPDRELARELQTFRSGQSEAAAAFRAEHGAGAEGIGASELELLLSLGYLE